MVRPAEGERICTRIKPETLAVIDRLAKERGVSRAAVIRQLLEEATK